MIVRDWLVVLVFLPLGACVMRHQADLQLDDANPRFEWFEYTGNAAVYEMHAAGPEEHMNPLLSGFYPDPSIVRVEEDFYLVTSSFAYYPGIPLFHSRDLVHWTQLGHVLDRPSQLDLDSLRISRGVFAPTIRFHDGTFYVICTLVDAGGNFLVTATDPGGPWSDPVWLPFDGIDPSIFFDADARVYITNNGAPSYEPLYAGHRAIWIQEFDLETQEMIGPRQMIVDGGVNIEEEPVWIEAPHQFTRDGLYYLIAAEGGTGVNHSEVVFRSDDPMGPYEPYDKNPILTQRHLDPGRPFPVTSSGHADFVELPNGDWWAVFLATRPYANDFYNTGRETFMLPVECSSHLQPSLQTATSPWSMNLTAAPWHRTGTSSGRRLTSGTASRMANSSFNPVTYPSAASAIPRSSDDANSTFGLRLLRPCAMCLSPRATRPDWQPSRMPGITIC
jgi:alpha-N-arabinofuranosidase